MLLFYKIYTFYKKKNVWSLLFQLSNGLSFEPTVQQITEQAELMKPFHEADPRTLYDECKWPDIETIIDADKNNPTTSYAVNSIWKNKFP